MRSDDRAEHRRVLTHALWWGAVPETSRHFEVISGGEKNELEGRELLLLTDGNEEAARFPGRPVVGNESTPNSGGLFCAIILSSRLRGGQSFPAGVEKKRSGG